jgi:chromosome segregation ATPase
MVQAGLGLDTPRTNVGDATYLHQPDFDISQEQSFQSPSKDNNNILQQLQNGRRGGINLKTPRRGAALQDRRNAPTSLGAGEFTPLLKSATRNSALRYGKENGVPRTPAFLRPGGLDNVAEELSPVPALGSSMYGDDTRNGSYMAQTPMPHIDSSAASTPMVLLPRRGEAPGVLQDGNQLSLREQENVIDRIEKENFGLKLKIHFLEEALKKAGPGFSQAALKENTELKVDKVTMQKELHRYKKMLSGAESDLEAFQKQAADLQEKAKRRPGDDAQREELDRLRREIDEKEEEARELREQLENADRDSAQLEKLRDEIGDLEADLREKERAVDDRDDEIERLKGQVEDNLNNIEEIEEAMKAAQRRAIELEELVGSKDDLDEAKETIEDLQEEIKRLKAEISEAQEDRAEALREKEHAESNLEELQDEMSNKSIATKGLNRQIEEKANRLQDELLDLRERFALLEDDRDSKAREMKQLQEQLDDLEHDSNMREQKLKDEIELAQQQRDESEREKISLSTQLQSLQAEVRRDAESKNLLQNRHDALTAESAGLQKDLTEARKTIENMENRLDNEKGTSAASEHHIHEKYQSDVARLNDEIEDLQAELREKERLYDDDHDKWDTDRRNLEAERDRAEERAAGLQRTIDRLQDSKGALSSKESQMQEALQSEKERHEREEASLKRQIEELSADILSRRQALEDVRNELSTVKEALRNSQREQKSLCERAEGLEDEVEVLQTTFDEESERAKEDVAAARQDSESLRAQLQSVKQQLASAEAAIMGARMDAEGCKNADAGSRDQLGSQLTRVQQEKQMLQDQLGNSKLEIVSLRTAAAEIQAERDELQSQLRDMRQYEETFRLDQEKLDLRTSKLKLENELRRLHDEREVHLEQLQQLEHDLQDEVDRATAEESRLISQIKDLIQLEASQKQTVCTLKKQISDLERKAQDNEVSHLRATSPGSPPNASARKSEVAEVHRELMAARQTIRDLRSQIRGTGVSNSRNYDTTSTDIQARVFALENERDELQDELSAAISVKKELTSLNTANENTVKRLRSKVERLERELQHERQNIGEDRTMALERRDLHSMLRETQVQAEELELVIKERDATIAALSSSEASLRAQITRIREERAKQRDRAIAANNELEDLELAFHRAQEAWENEKRTLNRGVRFPNMSISAAGANESLLVREAEEREKRHVKELRGLGMQIEWLRARCKREEGLRADAAYAKKFMLLQVELFGAWYVPLLRFLFPRMIRSYTTESES